MMDSKIYYDQNQWWIIYNDQTSLLDAAYTDSLDKNMEYQVNKVNENGQIELKNGAILFKTKSKAPYNFVSLPDKIVTIKKIKNFDKYEGNCGFFEIELVSETDIFVRGDREQFYQSTGQYAIPGSTIRGMLRNLVEIVSYSTLNIFEKDTQYYFRDVVDKSYLSQVVKDNQIIAVPAYIKIVNGMYVIKDANPIGSHRYLRVENLEEFKFVGNKPIHKTIYFNLKEVENNLITNCSLNNIENQYSHEATLVMTGSFGVNNKDRKFWVIGSPKSKFKVELGKKQIETLLEDKTYKFWKVFFPNNRENDDDRNINKTWMPIFYITNQQNEIMALSHTPFIRLRYDKKVEAHNIAYKFGENETDITQSIFGSDKMEVAGKLMVEDAYIQMDVKANETVVPHILSSPKPTSYQLYLESDGITTHNYNSDAALRGYKLYHHKLKKYFNENSFSINVKTAKSNLPKEEYDKLIADGIFQEKGDKLYVSNKEAKINQLKDFLFNTKAIQSKPIRTLPPKTEFKGKIRFSNLTDVELGTLLFILNFPDPLRIKLGAGKSLGMGTVKLSAAVHIEDMKQRYANLLDNLPGLSAIKTKCLSEEEIKQKVDSFEKHLSSQGIPTPLWTNNSRIQDLYTMLYYDSTLQSKAEWLENTDYMALGEFNRKNPLPKPNFIKNKFKINDNK